MLSDNYRYQIINNFEKFIDQKDIENTLMINAQIFFVIYIQFKLTRLLKDYVLNIDFNDIRKLSLDPIHLVNPDSTRSTPIYSEVLLIYLLVPKLALLLIRSN